MADYKIANIKWLRDQGWNISSSYASDLCPTYNEIVNEIPKGSITVNVNGTCIATSKAYANNQLVCESDISIGSDCPQYQITPDKQVTCDGGIVHFTATTDNCTCSQVGVDITELNISADSALTQVGVITTNDCVPNVTYESTQPTWLTGVTPHSNDIRIKCSENTTYNSRSGSVNVKMNGNTCSTVNVTQAGKDTDCSVYGWSGTTLYEHVRDSAGGAVGVSLASAGTLVLYDKPSWVTYITANTAQTVIAYIVKAEDSDGSRRSGTVVFRSSDGNCEFSGTVIQAAQASAIHITFSGLPPNLRTGGLSMTGSTYTAQFILAGPNAGTGTLYGTLSPSDSRQVMTFSGQFTLTSGGGNIVNACDGTSTSHIYTVSTASWDATTSTLNVTFGVCS